MIIAASFIANFEERAKGKMKFDAQATVKNNANVWYLKTMI